MDGVGLEMFNYLYTACNVWLQLNIDKLRLPFMPKSERSHSSVSLPNPLLEAIDNLVKTGVFGFRSRAEFVAEATRSYLREVQRMNVTSGRKERAKK